MDDCNSQEPITININKTHCQCGNGVTETENGEECDAGINNGTTFSGCSSSCQLTFRTILIQGSDIINQDDVTDIPASVIEGYELSETYLTSNCGGSPPAYSKIGLQMQKCTAWDTNNNSCGNNWQISSWQNNDPDDFCYFSCGNVGFSNGKCNNLEEYVYCDHAGVVLPANAKFMKFNGETDKVKRTCETKKIIGTSDDSFAIECTKWNPDPIELNTSPGSENSKKCDWKCKAGYSFSNNNCLRSNQQNNNQNDPNNTNKIVKNTDQNVSIPFSENNPGFWNLENGSYAPSISRAKGGGGNSLLDDVTFYFSLPNNALPLNDPDISDNPIAAWQIVGQDKDGNMKILRSEGCLEDGGSSICVKDFHNNSIIKNGVIEISNPSGKTKDGKIKTITNFLINPDDDGNELYYPSVQFSFAKKPLDTHGYKIKKILYKVAFTIDGSIDAKIAIPDQTLKVLSEGISQGAKQAIEIEIEPSMKIPFFNYAVSQQ